MKKKILELIIVYICVLICTYVMKMFNQHVLMSLPLYGRMICMPLFYWLIALAPMVLYIRKKYKLAELGLSKHNILRQILTGIVVALVISVVLTLIPHLLGFSEMVDNGNRFIYIWQYPYYFFYYIVAVGAVEEFVFRGYFYNRFKDIFSKEWIAILGSSILFGFLHIFQGNIFQVFTTMLIGAFWCIVRLKVKNCSLLSLIIAHGIYNTLISVWASIFLQ